MNKEYWTKEMCMREIQKYSSYTEFTKGSPSLYKICRKKGWLDDVVAVLPKKYHVWSYEKCLLLANKCNSFGEFVKKHRTAYNLARYHGWLDKIKEETTFNKKKAISKEEIIKIISGYSSISRLRRERFNIYAIAKREGLI